MVDLEERVEDLHAILADFMRDSQRIMLASQQQIAAIREEVAAIRLSNARTDRILLEMRQESDRERARIDAEFLRTKTEGDQHRAEDKAQFNEWVKQNETQRATDSVELEEWKKENERKHAEAEIQRAQSAVELEEWKKENERKRAEAAAIHEAWKKENERRRAEAEIQRSQAAAEHAEWKKEADRKFEQAERERKDFNRRLAEATDSQGLMIENMVWPNLRRIATQVFCGGEVVFSGIRLKRRLLSDRGRVMELDLLAVGENEVLVCEAKSKVDDSKVREFLDKLRDFPAFFPDYAGLTLRPMIASIYFEESVINHMTNLNVIALGFGDETMEVLNPQALAGPAA